MPDRYLFDKKMMAVLVSGFTAVGFLLFIAGLVVGISLNSQPLASPAPDSANTEGPMVAAVPASPPPPQPAPTPELPKLSPSPEPVAPEKEKRLPEPELAPADPPDSPDDAEQRTQPSEPDEPAPAQETKEELKPAPRREPKLQPLEAGAFSVQVGCFLVEENARRMVEHLRAKGYRPVVFEAADAANRRWYSVRIGAYANREEAASAASSFRLHESIVAIVRPVRAL